MLHCIRRARHPFCHPERGLPKSKDLAHHRQARRSLDSLAFARDDNPCRGGAVPRPREGHWPSPTSRHPGQGYLSRRIYRTIVRPEGPSAHLRSLGMTIFMVRAFLPYFAALIWRSLTKSIDPLAKCLHFVHRCFIIQLAFCRIAFAFFTFRRVIPSKINIRRKKHEQTQKCVG